MHSALMIWEGCSNGHKSMAYFRYKAFGNDGKSTTGLVDAPEKSAAVRLLKEKGLFVVSLSVAEDSPLSAITNKIQRVGFNEIVNFTRQLSTMITAGLTLPDALSILRQQTTNPILSDMLRDVERQIVGGGTLSAALSHYPKYFSNIYISLIKAGEASGLLDKVMARLSENMEAQREFRGKVTGAMIYPAIIVTAMVIVVAIMMTVVMPKLTDLYKEFNIDLPVTTRILIGISDFSVKYWWLVLLLLAGAVYGFLRWKKTKTGEYIIDGFILKIPVFGPLQTKKILVEFTRTLSMLVASGIHILDALKILRNSLGNVRYRLAIDDIAKKVEKGFPLGDSFAQHKEFPPIVSQMMKVGEETGKIDETLQKVSVYFQAEVEVLVRGLTAAIEPIIMVVLGVGVGFIIISVITPIYNLTAQFK